jgi:hypothetical protein
MWTGQKCPICKGYGQIMRKENEINCPDCAGTGDEWKKIMITLELTKEEAEWLRDRMQKPIQGNESYADEQMRHSFFSVCNEGLGEGHRNKEFVNGPDDIPF